MLYLGGKPGRFQDFRHALVTRVAGHDAPDSGAAQDAGVFRLYGANQPRGELRAVGNGDFGQRLQHTRAEIRNHKTAVGQQFVAAGRKHCRAVRDRIDIDRPTIFLVHGRKLIVRHRRNYVFLEPLGKAISGMTFAIAVAIHYAQPATRRQRAIQYRGQVATPDGILYHPAA